MNLLLVCNLLNVGLLTAIHVLRKNGHKDINVGKDLPSEWISLLRRELDKDGLFESNAKQFKQDEDFYTSSKDVIVREGSVKQKIVNNDGYLCQNRFCIINGIAAAIFDVTRHNGDKSNDCYLCENKKTGIRFGDQQIKHNFLTTIAKRTNERWYVDKGDFKVLENYLSGTFLRLKQENKLKEVGNSDNRKIIFNSGISDKDTGRYIYIKGSIKPQGVIENLKTIEISELSKYHLNSSEIHTASFNIPSYTIDSSWDIETDDASWFHITRERIGRLSDYRECRYKGLNEIEMERLFKATVRDERPAICSTPFFPSYYFNSKSDSKVQYLMPLFLDKMYNEESTPSCVLVLTPDPIKKILKPHTILTPSMAYMNARLVCSSSANRPNKSWLNVSELIRPHIK